MQILLLAAIDVVDAAMQDEFGGAALDFAQRNFAEQGNRILIELRASGWDSDRERG